MKIKGLKENGQVKDKRQKQNWNIENLPKQDHSRGTRPMLS